MARTPWCLTCRHNFAGLIRVGFLDNFRIRIARPSAVVCCSLRRLDSELPFTRILTKLSIWQLRLPEICLQPAPLARDQLGHIESDRETKQGGPKLPNR